MAENLLFDLCDTECTDGIRCSVSSALKNSKCLNTGIFMFCATRFMCINYFFYKQ